MLFNIRVAVPDDVPRLAALIPASVRGLSNGYYTARQVESALVYVFGIDSQLIRDGTYFVAESGNTLVGCGGWSKRNTLFGGNQTKGTEDPLLDPARDAARIRAFFVHPDCARLGIGRRLMHTCEEAARSAGFRRATLGATLPGEPLYAAMGYEAVERFALQFPDGEAFPLVKMEKELGIEESES
jgi:GNAT superfamily N-acetyltransferase